MAFVVIFEALEDVRRKQSQRESVGEQDGSLRLSSESHFEKNDPISILKFYKTQG